MADKFIRRDHTTGQLTEREAITASAGAADAGKIPALGTGGVFDQSMLPTGIGPEVQTAQAAEALADNDMVYLYDDAGTMKVAKASADVGGNAANGMVLAAAAISDNVQVYMSQIKVPDLLDVNGDPIAIGARVFLSDATPGKVTTTPVTGSNKLHQQVGFGLAGDGAMVRFGEPVKLA